MRVAAVQMDIAIGRKDQNLQNILSRLKEAARNKADLVIFPECALQGYCFSDRDEAWALSEETSGAACARLADETKRLGCTAVVGFIERHGKNLFNSALVIGPEGIAGVHRKIHLLHLGVDRFTTLGDIPFPLFQAGNCRFGVNICFDCSFPESGRAIKLKGAQLLAIPTNWPATSDSWEHTPKVRATENHIFVAAADRVGEERGFTFAGHSQIIDCEGHTLAEADATEETILYADIDPAMADKNRVIKIPGEYEFDRIASRRPEMYETLRDKGQITIGICGDQYKPPKNQDPSLAVPGLKKTAGPPARSG